MKKLIVSLLLLVPLQIARGQDKIITLQNDTIYCRIISVSSTHIQYEQKVDGYMVGKFILTEQVSEYLRSSQPVEINPYDWENMYKPKLPKPTHRWLIGVYPGRASLLASTKNDEKEMIDMGIPKSQVMNYSKQYKHGWSINGDIHYLFSDYFGLGARYSLFLNSVQQDFTIKINTFLPEFLSMGIKEKIYIHYAGPSVIFRQWLDENHKFQLIETLSAGYVHYRNELRQDQGLYKVNVLAEGNTWGANAGLSVGYYPLPRLSVGVNAGFMYARLTKMEVSTKESMQTVELEKKDYEYLTRLDYSFSIRFHF